MLVGKGRAAEVSVGVATLCRLGDRSSLQRLPLQHSYTIVLVLRPPEQISGGLKSVRRQPKSRLILPSDSTLTLA